MLNLQISEEGASEEKAHRRWERQATLRLGKEPPGDWSVVKHMRSSPQPLDCTAGYELGEDPLAHGRL